jgi:hypothetical protein
MGWEEEEAELLPSVGERVAVVGDCLMPPARSVDARFPRMHCMLTAGGALASHSADFSLLLCYCSNLLTAGSAAVGSATASPRRV